MKSTNATPLVFASVIAFALIFAVTPSALADSGDGSHSYKRHWAIPIGAAEGSLQITEDVSKADLKAQATPLDELDLSDYTNISKARIGKAVNDSGNYYLVWKLVSAEYNAQDDTSIRTIYVLDAKTGEQLTEPMIKEGGSCGDKHKSETTPTSGESA